MQDNLDFIFDDVSNPLDGIEDVLSSEKFAYQRMNRDELFAEIQGRYGIYRMMFAWDDVSGAMQFCCEYDLTIPSYRALDGFKAIARMNTNLWLGHFDLHHNRLQPCFRHTQLFRGITHSSGAEHLQDIMAIAVEECDKHYPVFAALIDESHTLSNDSIIDFALSTPQGNS